MDEMGHLQPSQGNVTTFRCQRSRDFSVPSDKTWKHAGRKRQRYWRNYTRQDEIAFLAAKGRSSASGHSSHLQTAIRTQQSHRKQDVSILLRPCSMISLMTWASGWGLALSLMTLASSWDLVLSLMTWTVLQPGLANYYYKVEHISLLKGYRSCVIHLMVGRSVWHHNSVRSIPKRSPWMSMSLTFWPPWPWRNISSKVKCCSTQKKFLFFRNKISMEHHNMNKAGVCWITRHDHFTHIKKQLKLVFPISFVFYYLTWTVARQPCLRTNPVPPTVSHSLHCKNKKNTTTTE